ncbi:hypothetical protein [Puniceibacterium sp. IMCC21224]|uniref:hypothetical protein n=1 Tax=Puniceibacterium sp. IMCC21224 TaxID=1618204 RepID=UPI0012E09D02|nr:hypothetical protein [Puniceibacterium sp. IMCC21224]
MPSDTDQDDYTLYLSFDDARITPGWRIRDYIEHGCRTEAKQAELRGRFGLGAAIGCAWLV